MNNSKQQVESAKGASAPVARLSLNSIAGRANIWRRGRDPDSQGRARHGTLRRRLKRYFSLAILTAPLGQCAQAYMLIELDWNPVPAAWWTFVLMSGPGYVLNRRIVWGRQTRGSLVAEVLPYWTFSFLGLIAAVLTAERLASLDASSWLYIVGSVLAYGFVQIARFIFLERWIFG